MWKESGDTPQKKGFSRTLAFEASEKSTTTTKTQVLNSCQLVKAAVVNLRVKFPTVKIVICIAQIIRATQKIIGVEVPPRIGLQIWSCSEHRTQQQQQQMRVQAGEALPSCSPCSPADAHNPQPGRARTRRDSAFCRHGSLISAKTDWPFQVAF